MCTLLLVVPSLTSGNRQRSSLAVFSLHRKVLIVARVSCSFCVELLLPVSFSEERIKTISLTDNFFHTLEFNFRKYAFIRLFSDCSLRLYYVISDGHNMFTEVKYLRFVK